METHANGGAAAHDCESVGIRDGNDFAGELVGGETCAGNGGRQQQANLDLERFQESRLLHSSAG
jgi:hypothetical protein